MKIHNPKVMVVDDDGSVRAALVRLFKSAGMDVQDFASAEEFLASRQLQSASCLIIDVQMPGMRGTKLQEICANDRPDVPIIMISAFHDDATETRSLAAGAVAFLHKPFDAALLVNIVRQVVEPSDTLPLRP